MARITCKIPSTGKPLSIRLANVPATDTVLVEAPDFSIPDTSQQFATRDPADANRAIRPGEVFFLTPLYARNKTSTTRWIEVSLLSEAGDTYEVLSQITVPGNETVALPVQGLSLLKRTAANANGDRLVLKAENATAFDVWGAAEERPSSEHIGVV